MTTFDNGLAGPTALTYDLTIHTAAYIPGSSAAGYPSQNLTTPRYVVTNVNAPNGIGTQYVVNYLYWYGLQDLTGRGFLGFAYVWATNSQTHLLKSTNYNQTFPTIGDVMDEFVDNTTVNPAITVKNVVTTYSAATAYDQRTYPYVSKIVTTGNDLNLQSAPLPTTTQTFDSNGAILPDRYGNDQSVTTTVTQNYGGLDTVYTTTDTYAYQNDEVGWSPTNNKNWIIDRLTSKQVTASSNSSSPATRLTTYMVDENTGFTSSETVQPGTGPNTGTGYTLTTQFTYDQYGHQSQAVETGDGSTRTTMWNYNAPNDPGHEFLYKTTNALAQSAYTTFDPRWGALATATDVDGRLTQYTYDYLGRKSTETLPDQSTITTVYPFCAGVNNGGWICPNGGQYAVGTTHIGVDHSTVMSPAKFFYYDTLDRDIDDDVQSFRGHDSPGDQDLQFDIAVGDRDSSVSCPKWNARGLVLHL